MEYCRYKQKVKKNKHGEDLKKIRSYLLNTGVLIATDQELTLAWYEFSDDLCDSGWMDVSDELLRPFSEWLEGYVDTGAKENESTDGTCIEGIMVRHREHTLSYVHNISLEPEESEALLHIVEQHKIGAKVTKGSAYDISANIERDLMK